MLQDLRYALRQLRETPGFAAVAILTLALGIGVNAAVFSLVDAIALRPVNAVRPHELVSLHTARQAAHRDYRPFSYAEFTALREPGPAFADVAAMHFMLAGVGRDDDLRRSAVFFTSENAFALLGAQPELGRFFSATEARPGADIPVAVASHGFWRRRGGRLDFVGSTVRVNGRPVTIVGVAPAGFTGINALVSPDLWLPLGMVGQFSAPSADRAHATDLTRADTYALTLIARLQPDLTPATLAGPLGVLERRLEALRGGASAPNERRALQAGPPSRLSIGAGPADDSGVRVFAVLLLGMAAVVLIIASLNLANMLLARNTARQREFAIRLSLGATRRQVVRQLLVEGLLLALLGGAGGLLAANWANELLAHTFNARAQAMNFPLTLDLQPEGRVLAATVLYALVATVSFSLLPALRCVRPDIAAAIRLASAGVGPADRWNRFFSLRHCLVMGQLALSLALLFAGGLFLRGALKAAHVDRGFHTENRLVAEIDFAMTRDDEPTMRRRSQAVLQRAARAAGVRQAALTTTLPYTDMEITRRVAPAETAPAAPDAPPPGSDGLFAGISSGYFQVLGVPVVRGRVFTEAEADLAGTAPVAVVDTRLAETLFSGADPLGRRIRCVDPVDDTAPVEFEIVGIVAAHRHGPQKEEFPGHLYVPLAHAPAAQVFLLVHTDKIERTAEAAATEALREELRASDPALPLLRAVPFGRLVERNMNLWLIQLGGAIFTLLGATALFLAVLGVYGISSYAVLRRTREIGIRIAVGAQPREVVRLVVRQGLKQALFALAVGAALALLAGRILSSALYDVSPADPLSLGLAAGILATASLLANWIPARRATRVDPLVALRAE
ncbi:MAG TPA: ADOP family duplicated permease [Opitutaceae bacterium]|nr:ADOP family duplicated permease [Opitutaceae bacterium]